MGAQVALLQREVSQGRRLEEKKAVEHFFPHTPVSSPMFCWVYRIIFFLFFLLYIIQSPPLYLLRLISLSVLYLLGENYHSI
jgi:hypothetical protein